MISQQLAGSMAMLYQAKFQPLSCLRGKVESIVKLNVQGCRAWPEIHPNCRRGFPEAQQPFPRPPISQRHALGTRMTPLRTYPHMLDGTKAHRIREPHSGSINPGTTRPALDEFRRGFDRIADDFEAQLRTQDTDVVLGCFVAARDFLRRHRQPRWWFLLTGGLAAKEWLRRRGYSPSWSESQVDDIFAALVGDDRDWCEKWYENRTQ